MTTTDEMPRGPAGPGEQVEMQAMPKHMPTTEMLADYASGAASPGVSLLIAAHLTHAPESRARVGAFEAVGGALLADEQPLPMSAAALDDVLARLDGDDAQDAPVRHDPGPLPGPVIEAVGRDFDKIAWKFRLPGVAECELDGYPGEKVSLLRARPGARMPQHTHEGRELTLVLAGVLQDGDEVYRAGDVAINTEDDDHRPEIIGDETCYCLIVMSGGLRFTGRFSRALNFLAE
ncbi:ChrR family anti-sigma-E factor [Limibaculum sp. FT325]|uniref:ChrR family anti-sigma-E factor n=1 Tax=Thermohalobaculum sediminis TaxID=2939436 RepID=UPI0020BF9A09|nr:ChrR family anti-sigma-E factor [Limibaculum sediminis]MCL5777426.1 ChrR family anti-sigma-E factor [Limibaculum sediminis]